MDFTDKTVCDLGCGCAILSIAAVLQGALYVEYQYNKPNFIQSCNSYVMGIDTDTEALKIAQDNLTIMDLENEVDFVCFRLEDEPDIGILNRLNKSFDTVSSKEAH